jgi:(2Fe-2S) ferredoxin
MTLDELKTRLAVEKHTTGGIYLIECGEKCEAPGVLGIYEENGVWYVYLTDDRGDIIVVAKGTENDMTDALYRRILKAEKRYLKNHL